MKRSRKHKDMTTIKIWAETLRDLKLLAVLRDASMVEWLDRLVKEDLQEARKEEEEKHYDQKEF